MNFIDFVMAIPIGIAITSLFIGVLLLVAYFYYKITNDNKFIMNLVHILNRYYIVIFVSSFIIGYGLTIYFIYKTFF